jgi:tRNA 2-(methylsulfanyl)-N6-isopentenyladenosine37 hydroxylase
MIRLGRSVAIDDVLEFLPCGTPQAWFDQAPGHLSTLLIDHANCEKKAAGTALSLLFRYVDKPDLLQRLSRLAREELRHFEQVHDLLQMRDIAYVHLTPSRYAAGLIDCVRPAEPFRLTDTLLMGAVVEARSCERFAGLAAVAPDDLADFYRGLLAAEARHFRHYLQLARTYAVEPVEAKLDELLARDACLVTEPATEFRFHSGPLALDAAALRAGAVDN